MNNQLLLYGVEPLASGEIIANRLDAVYLAKITAIREQLSRDTEKLGSGLVRELIRYIFKDKFSNMENLSKAITQACNEPEKISLELTEEAKKYLPHCRVQVARVLRKPSEKGASNE